LWSKDRKRSKIREVTHYPALILIAAPAESQ
jgi:hypothetical protein